MNLENAHRGLAEGLQRRAHWHLAAQDWENYLLAVSDLVTLYENQNTAADRVAALMGAQGREIQQWLDLAHHAHRQLVQAIDHAQDTLSNLVAAEQKREHRQIREMSDDLARRR